MLFISGELVIAVILVIGFGFMAMLARESYSDSVEDTITSVLLLLSTTFATGIVIGILTIPGIALISVRFSKVLTENDFPNKAEIALE